MRKHLAKPIYVCVEGLYVRDAKYLLLKRNVDPFRGFWHTIGGHVEEKESLKEAVAREFKEETNLDVKVGAIVGGRIEETCDRVKIIVTFAIKNAEGTIQLNSENSESGWFPEIPSKSVYDYSKISSVKITSVDCAMVPLGC